MISAILAASLALAPCQSSPSSGDEQIALWAADRDARMAWWREARFGMFVHWGLYSPAGGMWEGKRFEQHYAEWIQNWASVPSGVYAQALKPRFQPAPGFADAWAELAQEAGMRYAVLTAKHHDGFTLFNSKESYSLENPVAGGTNISPAGRDVAREFAQAMRARGLRAGFYYSLLDWQHPDAYEMSLPGYPKPQPGAGVGPRDHAKYIAYLRGHVNELLSNYGPLATIWFDFSDAARQGEAWGSAQLMADMRAKQPGILVNNRLFDGLENKRGDFGTPEKYVPPTGLSGMDWEVNHTLNESYGFSSHDVGWKSTTTVIRLLCDIVSKGGNLLLNIGPDGVGRVPEEAQKTLHGVGAWMRTNAEAIYGTTASPFGKLAWGCATQKPGTLYLMLFDWPANGVLRVPLRNEIKSAEILGQESPCVCAHDAATGGWTLTLAKLEAPDAACTVVRLAIEGTPDPLAFAVLPAADGSLLLTPHDATLSGASLRIEQVGTHGEVKYNVGWWSDPADFLSWPIAVAGAGRYAVTATLACKNESAGSMLALDAGGAPIEAAVAGTGGWNDYREVRLGSVDVPAGSSVVSLRAKSKPGEAVVNLRSIRLVRIAK